MEDIDNDISVSIQKDSDNPTSLFSENEMVYKLNHVVWTANMCHLMTDY